MFVENRNEPTIDDSTLTRERLFVVAKELINHLWEAVGDTKETYTILTDCIGLTETEIEELTSGEITDHKETMFDKLSFEWELEGKSKMCSGNEYRVTLTYGDNYYTFLFHTNYRDEKNDREFLSCLFNDALAYENNADILDFKDEFGYEDNAECRRVYNACRDTSIKLHNLFNDQEFDDLYNEITFGE